MENDDASTRLDFWADRQRRTRTRSRTRPSRARPLAAAVLIAALAAGWLLIARRDGSAAPPARAVEIEEAAAPTSSSSTSSSTVAAPFDLGGGRGCVAVQGRVPELTCVVDRVRVDARLVGLAAAPAEYVAVAGARIAARAGAPACARGLDDERAWSRPSAPTRVVGRYRCRMEGGRAAMWWTDERGVVAHAVAPDADLAGLFAWWRVHLEV